MAGKGSIVIIKRVKKSHGGAHGGSWKVAYADFVTAMMAFFLLMWLLSMTSSEKKALLSQYFKYFSLFEQSGTSFMEQTSSIKTEISGEIVVAKEKTLGTITFSPKAIAEKLKSAVKEKLASVENRVLIEATEEGVRIQIIDPDGTLFPAGSAEPTKTLKDILKVVADNIKDMNNLIALEGHTDSSPYSVGRNTNWELSSSRASAARYLLTEDGVDPDRVSRVVGFADKHPYIENDPKDPRNRRISILVMQERLEKPETPSAEEQKPAPPPPGVNILEPSMSSEDSDRRAKEVLKQNEEKSKEEAKKPKEVGRPQHSGPVLKTEPFQPIVPKAETQKGTKTGEKPSGMRIIEPKMSPEETARMLKQMKEEHERKTAVEKVAKPKVEANRQGASAKGTTLKPVIPETKTFQPAGKPSGMRIIEPKAPPGLNIIEPRKPPKQ